MQPLHARRLLPAAFLALTTAAAPVAARPDAAPRGADPLDASAAVPPLIYRSTLSTIRRPGNDGDALSWRDANARVARIGGWRAYAREAHAPDVLPAAPPPADAASRPPSAPVPDRHHGHRKP